MLRILVAGGDGQLGQEFAGLSLPDVELVRCSRSEMDITDPATIHNALAKYEPGLKLCAAVPAATIKIAATTIEKAGNIDIDFRSIFKISEAIRSNTKL